jgi:hypothetical protein
MGRSIQYKQSVDLILGGNMNLFFGLFLSIISASTFATTKECVYQDKQQIAAHRVIKLEGVVSALGCDEKLLFASYRKLAIDTFHVYHLDSSYDGLCRYHNIGNSTYDDSSFKYIVCKKEQ